MSPMRRALRLTTSAVIAGTLIGCTSWRVQTMAPRNVIAERHPEAAWVTWGNRPSVLLDRPEIRRDSIIGWEKSAGIMAIPLAEVTRITIREPDGGKTAGLVGSIVAGLGIGVYFVIRSALAGG